MDEFILRIFVVPEEAEAYAKMLDGNRIEAEIRAEAGPLPDYFLGGRAAQRYLLLIQSEQSEHAEQCISEWMMQQVKEHPPNAHPFRDYDYEALSEILKEGKVWSDYELAYARWLLEQKHDSGNKGA